MVGPKHAHTWAALRRVCVCVCVCPHMCTFTYKKIAITIEEEVMNYRGSIGVRKG